MANITIATSIEDQNSVLKALRTIGTDTVPVATIAKVAGLKQSTTRYVLIDLIDAGKISRVPTKAFNKHYVRYMYKIIENSAP